MNGCIIRPIAVLTQRISGYFNDVELTDVSEDLKQNNLSPPVDAENADETSLEADAELQQYVLRKARLLLSGWPDIPSDAAFDLRQRAFLNYYKLTREQRDKIKDRRAYLYTILKHEVADFLREEKPGSVILLEKAEDTGTELLAPDEQMSIESGILLREIWAQLEGDERHLFELIILGYTSTELAFRLGISQPAARQRTSRLRNVLKELLIERLRQPE